MTTDAPPDRAAGPARARRVAATAITYGAAGPQPRDIAVPVEVPVEVAYGDVPFAVMMLTPGDFEDFAYGFSLTEGLIGAADDIRAVAVAARPNGFRVDVDLKPAPLARHFARRRALSGRTGCGVCGIADLAAVKLDVRAAVTPPPVDVAAVERAVAALDAHQTLNRETRAVHAAAWAGLDGRIVASREDVGRHNALDKLVGALLRAAVDPARGFLVITSRCSFEMVDKAAAFGAGMLVAVSAPTSLALDRAEALGMALLGIARRDGVTAFLGAGSLMDLDPGASPSRVGGPGTTRADPSLTKSPGEPP